MKTIKVFVSSPGDVAAERAFAKKVLKRLAEGFLSCDVLLTSYFWEDDIFEATKSYQDQIMELLEVDILICILWSRMGTPLVLEALDEQGGRTERFMNPVRPMNSRAR